MGSEGVPKVDTINLIYFIPGVTAVGGTLVGVGMCRSWFGPASPAWSSASSATFALALLAVSYIAGYALWGLGDVLWKSWSDRVISRWLFRYVCWERPLRTACINELRSFGHHQLAAAVGELSLTSAFRDSIEDAESTATLESTWETELLKQNGRRLRMFLWDTVYARNNPFFVGRFLSSWNNVKYVKATGTSLGCAGIVTLGCSFYAVDAAHGLITVLWSLLLLVLAVVHWVPLVRWRLRVYARDLAHGIAAFRKDES